MGELNSSVCAIGEAIGGEGLGIARAGIIFCCVVVAIVFVKSNTTCDCTPKYALTSLCLMSLLVALFMLVSYFVNHK